MARRISWIDRLHPMTRTVLNSARSHYDRRELEKIFELQPRAVQMLMTVLPTVPVGRARLVEREALLNLLTRLTQSDDPAQEFASIRTEKTSPSVRRKLRYLNLQDVKTDIDNLPGSIALKPGEMTVKFRSVDALAEAMMHLAVVLNDQLDEFVLRFEPIGAIPTEDAERRAEELADLDYLRSWG